MAGVETLPVGLVSYTAVVEGEEVMGRGGSVKIESRSLKIQ